MIFWELGMYFMLDPGEYTINPYGIKWVLENIEPTEEDNIKILSSFTKKLECYP